MGKTKRKSAASVFAMLLVLILLLITGFQSKGEKNLFARAQNVSGVPDYWVETSYQNVFRDAQKQFGARQAVNFLAVKNEYESEQIVLKHDVDFTVTGVTFTDLTGNDSTIAKENLTYNFVGYVEMNNSAGQNESTVVRWTGSVSTNTASSTMDLFLDRLYNRTSILVKANEAQPIYITMYVPKTSAAGIYSGSVTVLTSLGNITLPISAEIAEVAIADSKDGAYTQAFWQQLANTWKKDVYGLGVLYGHEKYSAKWWELMGNVADGLKATRMNSLAIYPLQLLLDAPDTKKVGDVYTFDFTYFDQFISFFLNRDVVKYLEGNALLGTTYATSTWGFILDNKPDGDGMYLRKVDKLYPNYAAGVAGKMDADCDLFYRQYLTALNRHLELRGWKDRWVQHIEDEAGSLREQTEYMDFVNNYFLPNVPNVRYGDPMDHAYADWFIENTTFLNPLTSQFDANKEKYEQAIENGTEVWLYSCLNPQGANLNKFIDKPVWQIRSIAWLSYAYGVTGHLQWSYNGWWTDAATGEVYIGQDEANVQRFKYKGDDFYVYPDIAGNTFEQSIRSLSSRDSSEEYELLAMVGGRDAAHKAWAENLVSKIVTSNTNYSTDTALMAKCRRDLIEVASKAKNIDEATPPFYEDDKPLFAQTEIPANVAAISFDNNMNVAGAGYKLATVGSAASLTYSDLSKKGKSLNFAGDQTTYLTLENSLAQMFNPAQTSSLPFRHGFISRNVL